VRVDRLLLLFAFSIKMLLVYYCWVYCYADFKSFDAGDLYVCAYDGPYDRVLIRDVKFSWTLISAQFFSFLSSGLILKPFFSCMLVGYRNVAFWRVLRFLHWAYSSCSYCFATCVEELIGHYLYVIFRADCYADWRRRIFEVVFCLCKVICELYCIFLCWILSFANCFSIPDLIIKPSVFWSVSCSHRTVRESPVWIRFYYSLFLLFMR